MSRSSLLVALATALTMGFPAMAQTGLATGTTDAAASQRIEGIAAIVNDAPISYSDVRQRARLLLLSLGGQPSQQEVQQIAGQALEQLIDEKLQLQEAAEYEVEVSPDDIARQISDMAEQSRLTIDDFYSQLLGSGVNPASLEDQMRAEIAWQRIMSGLYGSRIRISENQISEQLERLKSAASETQYLVSEIFLFAPDPENRSQAAEAALSIRAQILEGAAFELAAQRFSSAPTAATGGDMGWVSLEDVDPAVAEALAAMNEPGVTQPILVNSGVYLMSMRRKRDPQDAVVQVTLKRLLATDGNLEQLNEAAAEVDGCDTVESIAENYDAITAANLGRVTLSDLADDAAAPLRTTPVGAATAVFEARGGQAVMIICDRTESVDQLPSADEIENTLFGRELSMISQRELRNLRREATIIQRSE